MLRGTQSRIKSAPLGSPKETLMRKLAGQKLASSIPNAKNPESNKKEECDEGKTDIQRNLGSGNGG